MGGTDWADQALVSRVDQWVAAHAYPFIASTARLVRPMRAAATVNGMPAIRVRELGSAREPTQETGLGREPTGSFRMVDLHRASGAAAAAAVERARPNERGARPLVLPLKKVQTTFPSMITIGRTDNNDLIVPDEQISKFHAYFRIVGGRVEICDAGSRNGTFVGGRRLVAKSESAGLAYGDRFSLGALEFRLFDARGCWEWLRQLDRFA